METQGGEEDAGSARMSGSGSWEKARNASSTPPAERRRRCCVRNLLPGLAATQLPGPPEC